MLSRIDCNPTSSTSSTSNSIPKLPPYIKRSSSATRSAGSSASSKTAPWKTHKKTTRKPREKRPSSVRATKRRWPRPSERTRIARRENEKRPIKRSKRSKRMTLRHSEGSKRGNNSKIKQGGKEGAIVRMQIHHRLRSQVETTSQQVGLWLLMTALSI